MVLGVCALWGSKRQTVDDRLVEISTRLKGWKGFIVRVELKLPLHFVVQLLRCTFLRCSFRIGIGGRSFIASQQMKAEFHCLRRGPSKESNHVALSGRPALLKQKLVAFHQNQVAPHLGTEVVHLFWQGRRPVRKALWKGHEPLAASFCFRPLGVQNAANVCLVGVRGRMSKLSGLG